MTWRRFLVLAALPLLAASAAVQEAIERTPERVHELEASQLKDVPLVSAAIETTGTLMMGGLRGLAVDYLWIRLSDLKEDRQYLEAVQIAEILTRLQPRNEQVWSYLVHDLVYNIPANVEDAKEKWSYVRKGVLLGEEGCRRIPQSPFIRYNMGFTLYHRLQQDRFLAEFYRLDRGRNPFADARAWFEASRRALSDWQRREGPEATYYAPDGTRVSDDILSSFIRNVSLQDAGWTLATGGDRAAARAAILVSLAEILPQLDREDDSYLRRYRDTCEDLLRAVDLEAEAVSLARDGDPAATRARLEAVWKAYRQAILDPGHSAQPFRRRLDILEDTFFLTHWARLGLLLGGDSWEPNDEGPFWTVIDFARPVLRMSLGPLRDDIDRCSYHAPASGRARFTLRYEAGRLRPVVRMAAYAEGNSQTGWAEKGALEPARQDRGPDPADGWERLVVETPLLEARGEYLFEVRNAVDGPWSTAPYEVTAEFLPEPVLPPSRPR